MFKSLLLGAVLGGLVAFLWSSFSWEVIGWHERTMTGFLNEDEVAAVIASHAPKDGTYLLPAGPVTEGMSADQRKEVEAAVMEKMQKGPIMVAAVRHNFGSFGRAMAIQVLGLMVAALLLTWMLLQTRDLGYAGRVIFVAVGGLAASVIVDIPNWNWWGFSGSYTVVNLIDSTLTWLLAGLVIAKVARPNAGQSKA